MSKRAQHVWKQREDGLRWRSQCGRVESNAVENVDVAETTCLDCARSVHEFSLWRAQNEAERSYAAMQRLNHLRALKARGRRA